MNPKLKEIAARAGFNTFDVKEDGRFEKFANLLIRECIEIIEENADDIDNGDIFRSNSELLKMFEQRWSAGLYYSIEKIEERFNFNETNVDTP